LDVNDKQSINDLFKKHKFFAVLHLAALKAVGESVAKPLDYYHNNVSGTVNLLQVKKKKIE
jgi:UDP-glucose 4-epimerase